MTFWEVITALISFWNFFIFRNLPPAPPPPPPQPNGAAAAVKLNFDEYDVPCMLQYTANKVTNIVVH